MQTPYKRFVSLNQSFQCGYAECIAENQRSPIEGRLIALKDNICTRETPTTCASAFLNGYHSPFTATVVERLKSAGAVIAGTTNLDEFAMGSDSTNSYYGAVINSHVHDLSAGGSSGGSAVAVATEQCHAALGTDTGGSVRLPAAYNGIVGFKPSYGTMSRWGVVAYANSLDTVGILAKTVTDARKLFTATRSYDFQDPTSMDVNTRIRIADKLIDHTTQKKRDIARLRIGVPNEYNTSELHPAVRDTWTSTLHILQQAGHSVQAISLPATKIALSAYYILAPAEASSNLAKFDGARYGNKFEHARGSNGPLYSATRGHEFGEEVRRRILLGAFSLSAGAIDNYFIQAQKVRRLVQQDFNDVFSFPHPLIDYTVDNDAENEKVDVIMTPTTQSLPPQLSDLKQRNPIDAYSADVLTVPASLAGLPAINVPIPIKEHLIKDSMLSTIGIQIIGQFGTDMRVLDSARMIEKLYTKEGNVPKFPEPVNTARETSASLPAAP